MGTNPGINFVQVSVTDLNFKLNKDFGLPKKGINVEMGIDIKKAFSDDKKTLILTLTASLFQKTESAPFKMKVSVEGIFTGKDHEKLKKFSEIHAPAHLIPFLRETIANTTMKANLPTLLLPPFNISEMIKAVKSKKKTA